ncbi:unnamed protein product [Ambrosiozyma monospora]|uniref:phospholipase D n=1 Tax=Ambrosiozyma monospora TaxID=43982 RepID=A0A9W6WLC3_AMBMO|nr:unnamed protein product [Ambrosiozyma monospora]
MSISMGESSIFSKLSSVGIRPEEYIQFFSLRKWSYIGKSKLLVTEQLYIHAKTMVVDDRIAIIGSANINERSMRGTRDSEICAIVRDKDMVDSTMDGKPYKVGKFAHTLRMRLMREHLGVDVDLLEMVERRFSQIEEFSSTDAGKTASTLLSNRSAVGDVTLSAQVELATRYLLKEYDGTSVYKGLLTKPVGSGRELSKAMIDTFDDLEIDHKLDDIPYSYSFNHRAGEENIGLREKKNFSTDNRVTEESHRDDIKGLGTDRYSSKNYRSSKNKINEALKSVASATGLF